LKTEVEIENKRLALWVITENGLKIAKRIISKLPDARLHLSRTLPSNSSGEAYRFDRLGESVAKVFNDYHGHIFIMSTGIVVRIIAPHIQKKTSDPGVVVMDEKGINVISLLSGHLGGANRLAKKIAGIINANPVITTATDLNFVPAIDLIAQKKGLFIENPEAIKKVSMALLAKEKIGIHDPLGLIKGDIPLKSLYTSVNKKDFLAYSKKRPSVFIDDILMELPSTVLLLRPKTLTAGIGCNRMTPVNEIRALLFKVMEESGLSPNSLKQLGTIDLKADEAGITTLAEQLKLPVKYYTKNDLTKVDNIKSPSLMVEKHVGVKSVCEAAAILAANKGKLIVPKQKTKNVTVAIARESFTSLE